MSAQLFELLILGGIAFLVISKLIIHKVMEQATSKHISEMEGIFY